MRTNTDLKREALEALGGNWGTAVGLFLVVSLVSGAASVVGMIPIIGWIAVIFLTGTLIAGMNIFSLNLLKGGAVFEDGFKGFNDFIRLGSGYFMVTLFTMLWSMLLIVPGIIKSFSYAMTLYIMIEDPEIGVMDAIMKSREMMDGHKMDLVVLQLSFIGWVLLTMLTLGIGTLWLSPYYYVTLTAFYNDIKPEVKSVDELPEIIEVDY